MNQAQSRIAPLMGLADGWAPAPNYADVAQDLELDPRGGWREAAGFDQIVLDSGGASPFVGVGTVKSMFWFSQQNGGIQWLLWEQGGTLVHFNGSLSTAAKWTTLATGRYQTSMPSSGTQYVAVGNNVWIFNGEDVPLRFDGVTTYQAGFTGAAPTVSVDGFSEGFVHGSSSGLGLGDEATADADGGCATAYVMTETNEFGTESPPSPVAASVSWTVAAGSGTTRYFTRVVVPPRSRADVVSQTLYRCMNARGAGLQDQSVFYKLTEFRGAEGCVYVDDAPDSYLGPALDPAQFGPWPAGARYGGHFKGCMFLAGMPSEPDVVVYSSPVSIENFPTANFFRVGDPDSGEVTGIYPTRNALVVFKRRGIYLITGDPRAGFVARTLTKDVGCSGVNTVKELPGIGLVFASDAGVYVLIGISQEGDAPAQVEHISKEIQDFWQYRVNRGALANASGVIHHARKQYRLVVPTDGQPENDTALVYHYERATWTIEPNVPAACQVETKDHRGYLFFGSNDSTRPGVHYMSHWPLTKDGQAITPLYRSVPLDLDSVYEHVHVKFVNVRAVTYGNHALNVKYYLDRKSTPKLSAGQTRGQQDPEVTRPLWDVATWSATETWQREVPTVLRVSVDAVCKEFQWEVSLSGSGARIQILEAVLGYDYNSRRHITAIDTALATGTGS